MVERIVLNALKFSRPGINALGTKHSTSRWIVPSYCAGVILKTIAVCAATDGASPGKTR
jgi:hypothetical protein